MSHSARPQGAAADAQAGLLGAAREAGQFAPPPRESWLDAAESCYTRFGPAKTTVEDVAQAAGVSRATLYRHFKTRDQLLLAVIVREAGRLAAEAELQLRRFDDVGSWIVEGMLLCLREIPSRPLLAMLFAPEEVGVASRLVLTSERLLEIGAGILRPMFEPARRRGLLRESVRIEELMEWVLRVLLSYLTVPSHLARTDAELRHLLRVMILPAVLASPAAAPVSKNTLTKEPRDG
jgi:AcrR family transcriptional regulator